MVRFASLELVLVAGPSRRIRNGDGSSGALAGEDEKDEDEARHVEGWRYSRRVVDVDVGLTINREEKAINFAPVRVHVRERVERVQQDTGGGKQARGTYAALGERCPLGKRYEVNGTIMEK